MTWWWHTPTATTQQQQGPHDVLVMTTNSQKTRAPWCPGDDTQPAQWQQQPHQQPHQQPQNNNHTNSHTTNNKKNNHTSNNHNNNSQQQKTALHHALVDNKVIQGHGSWNKRQDSPPPPPQVTETSDTCKIHTRHGHSVSWQYIMHVTLCNLWLQWSKKMQKHCFWAPPPPPTHTHSCKHTHTYTHSTTPLCVPYWNQWFTKLF